MTLRETAIAGSFVLQPEPTEDERGFFARIFSTAELATRGLEHEIAETSIAYNHARWTLRGLHYQRAPHEETKLVRCTRGAVYDVVVDLRPDSPTRLQWEGIELSAENHVTLYVPRGCAHGYLTLEDETELQYQISHPYTHTAAAGVRWDDPSLGIRWPATPRVISVRDASFSDLQRRDT